MSQVTEQQEPKGELPPNATFEQKLQHYFVQNKNNPKFSHIGWPKFAEHFPELASKMVKKDDSGVDLPNTDKDENGNKFTLVEQGYKFGVNRKEDDVYGTMYSVWMMKWEGGSSGARNAPRRILDIYSGTIDETRQFLRDHKNETWKWKSDHWSDSIQKPIVILVKDERITD